MSGSQAMTFSKQDLMTVVQKNQINPNKLATLLALDEKAASQDQPPDEANLSPESLMEKSRLQLLKQLVQPYNLGFVTAVSSGDDFFFTTLVAGETGYLYYGEEEGTITLKETNPEEAAILLGNFIGVGDIVKTKTSLTMTMDGLLTLACLLDRLKRQRLENLVLHVVEEEPVTLQSLEEEWAIASETRDLRWTLPFLLEALEREEGLDLSKGLGELASMGITTKAKKQVTLTPQCSGLMELFQGPKGMLVVKSLYYHNGSLILDPLVFFRVSGHLYAIQGGNSVTWTSIDQGQYQQMMATILAPGETPAIDEKTRTGTNAALGTPVEAEQKKKPRPKFCRFCGTTLKARGKFCHSCGKEIGS
jgi:hypothetical protein